MKIKNGLRALLITILLALPGSAQGGFREFFAGLWGRPQEQVASKPPKNVRPNLPVVRSTISRFFGSISFPFAGMFSYFSSWFHRSCNRQKEILEARLSEAQVGPSILDVLQIPTSTYIRSQATLNRTPSPEPARNAREVRLEQELRRVEVDLSCQIRQKDEELAEKERLLRHAVNHNVNLRQNAEQKRGLDQTLLQIAEQLDQKSAKFLEEVDKRLERLNQRLENINKEKLQVSLQKLLAQRKKEEHEKESEESKKPNGELTGSAYGFLMMQNHPGVKPDQSNDMPALSPASQNGFDKITKNLYIDEYFAAHQSRLGHLYARKLFANEGDEIPTDTPEQHLNSIIALCWGFYARALQKEQGFKEGTFKIEDRDFVLYNFLLNYSKRVNSTLTGTTQDPLAHYSDNPFAYSRDASHYVEMKHKHRPYGIDIRFAKENTITNELPYLPPDKRHLLFGIADEEAHYVYLKPENHGIYYADGLPAHIQEFLVAQIRKVPALRNFFKQWGYDLGTDDDPDNRKERPVAEFLNTFTQALADDENFTPSQKELLRKQAKSEGFKILFTAAESSQSARLKKMVEDYAQEYDYLAVRNGKEIILTHDDLIKQLEHKQ